MGQTTSIENATLHVEIARRTQNAVKVALFVCKDDCVDECAITRIKLHRLLIRIKALTLS